MTKVGEHITLDIIGTKKEYDPVFFEKLVYKIAKIAKVTVLEISKYKFEPQGFTLVALLAESHISFHTFPEKGIISFDFFTCAKISPSVALDIIKDEIEHSQIIIKEFNRDTVDLYHDNYSSPGLKKSYVVNNVFENFKSKVGQHIEILELEQFVKAFFKGDGFIILYLNLVSKNFNNFTSPSRLFPNRKLLLTNINFADNFL